MPARNALTDLDGVLSRDRGELLLDHCEEDLQKGRQGARTANVRQAVRGSGIGLESRAFFFDASPARRGLSSNVVGDGLILVVSCPSWSEGNLLV